jgi:deoxyribodipyrimidine photo-lyase
LIPAIPPIRLTAVNEAPIRPDGDHVLYWMIATRRTRWSFGLQRALARAEELGKPLLVLEPLRAGYRWASVRAHRFVMDGMESNRRRFGDAGIAYHPYVEPEDGAGRGLLAALAERACVVVTDDTPAFFLPRMVAAAGERLAVRLEAVDSIGLTPLRAAEKAYPTAHSFRRFLQKNLADFLLDPPLADPLAAHEPSGRARISRDVRSRWPALAARAGDEALPAGLDPQPGPTGATGGEEAARSALARFLDERLDAYGEDRNHPDRDAASGLSPWLHFGHVATTEIVAGVLEREGWTPADLSGRTDGARSGAWGVGESAESFLDELVTWREVGHVFALRRPDDHDRWEGLPDWARRTLDEHAGDPRPHLYSREELEAARTHDPLWNAAQRQLRREGRIHNYLRMLWGKKVLEWSPTPRIALETLIELNNRWALDGRDPNSISGIFWVLGRFDRAWGPERPIFGKVRYMSSENTARKVRVKEYLRRYGAEETLFA